MTENQALLSVILADPDDDRPRLVYADWLEQHGQFDRARLIRVQIVLSRLPENADAAAALRVEEEPLEAACEKTLPQLEGIEWGSFERGLVRSVCAATPAAFYRHADSIAAVGSLSRVVFQTPDGFAVLAENSTRPLKTSTSNAPRYQCALAKNAESREAYAYLRPSGPSLVATGSRNRLSDRMQYAVANARAHGQIGIRAPSKNVPGSLGRRLKVL